MVGLEIGVPKIEDDDLLSTIVPYSAGDMTEIGVLSFTLVLDPGVQMAIVLARAVAAETYAIVCVLRSFSEDDPEVLFEGDTYRLRTGQAST